ncbi:YdcF family protein [Poseidonibacter lekithochrous]|uniref:YdcF family protein n=1 Tax=Poseidonibacter lekithochrous TaxID=1904463 RepID=UPI0013DBCCE4|nr:YdcF family protein [Poseidonibacter lekithochrous]
MILFLNAGRFFDVTTKPIKSDILISLGGDNGNRVKKTLELYTYGYSYTNKIILTGIDDFDSNMRIYELDWRIYYLKQKGVKEDNIIINDKAINSLEEIRDIKKYLIRNDLRSVIFISDPTHSRRLKFFIEEVFKYDKEGLSYQIVSSEAKWWNKNDYYKNADAIIFVINETIKLTYYYLNYKLGKYDEY